VSYYIIVEGSSSEAKIYPQWIGHINPSLERVFDLGETMGKRYYLISGQGYPNYLSVVENALEDMINHPNIDRLVIAVDAESMTYEAKLAEIGRVVSNSGVEQKSRTIVQTPCLEAWALGNITIVTRQPQDARLREYLEVYNVTREDPEHIPDYPDREMNRAQFAYDYLRKALQERFPRGTYSKRNPTVIAHAKYFDRIVERHQDYGHIGSFSGFLDAFTEEDGANS